MNNQSRRLTVLVVDDHPDNIDLVCQILENNYLTITASNGPDCLILAEKEQPDLILLDVMMPDMDGYQILTLLLGKELTKHIPVIFITARYKNSDRIVQGLELGAFDYITKPFDDEVLLARVGVATRVKSAEDTNRHQKQELEKQVKELSETQKMLHASNLKLDCANKELTAFSYSVSHDLRAPLRGIAGFSQILLEDNEDQLDEQGKDYLHRLCNGVERMDGLINSLLKLSQLSNSALNRRTVNLSDIASRVLTQLKTDTPKRQVETVIENNLYANVDADLVSSVVTNLLENAWKYSSKLEQTRIEFGQLKNNNENETIFFIKDNGVGFDMKHADKLFSTFYRLHTDREFSGTGIGLATVQRIIHRHGGRIWAEAETNQGATFFFTFP